MNGFTGAGALLLAVQVAMAMVLAWSCLCRATKMNGDTRREVRWSMAFEATAVGLVGGAPILPALMPRDTQAIASYFGTSWPVGHTPAGIWALFLLSILVVQLVTAKYWRAGVPAVFQQPTPAMPLRALAVVGLAAIILGLSLGAPAPVGATSSVDDEVTHVRTGQPFTCPYASGCVVMSAQFAAEWVKESEQLAAEVMRKDSGCRRRGLDT